jgi:3-oxoacyl-[acyl-carrier-protein] synthase-3
VTRIEGPARLSAYGIYAPKRILTNDELSEMVDTSDEWIVQRTGIRTRHVVSDGEYASHMAIGAVDDLLKHNPEIDLASIDYILAASSTSDYVYPSLSAMLQAHYELPNTIGAVDIATACAGFAYNMNLAVGLIASYQANRVLIVAADALTRKIDYTDRATCVLFGDGGAAAIVDRSDVPHIFGMDALADGTAGRFLYRTAVRSEINGKEDPSALLRQDGRDVYRWVMENMPKAVQRVLDRAGMTMQDIDWFAPHSANLRMIEALDKRLDFPLERTLVSVTEYGNTSAVSIPLALVPAMREGRVKPGDKVLVMGFGGGLVGAGSVLVV